LSFPASRPADPGVFGFRVGTQRRKMRSCPERGECVILQQFNCAEGCCFLFRPKSDDWLIRFCDDTSSTNSSVDCCRRCAGSGRVSLLLRTSCCGSKRPAVATRFLLHSVERTISEILLFREVPGFVGAFAGSRELPTGSRLLVLSSGRVPPTVVLCQPVGADKDS
jgi:hypothetical protein